MAFFKFCHNIVRYSLHTLYSVFYCKSLDIPYLYFTALDFFFKKKIKNSFSLFCYCRAYSVSCRNSYYYLIKFGIVYEISLVFHSLDSCELFLQKSSELFLCCFDFFSVCHWQSLLKYFSSFNSTAVFFTISSISPSVIIVTLPWLYWSSTHSLTISTSLSFLSTASVPLKL